MHFSPPIITLGGSSKTWAFRYHHGHQSHVDSQANLDDLFISSKGNVMTVYSFTDIYIKLLFFFI